jgi:hypothetical protein
MAQTRPAAAERRGNVIAQVFMTIRNVGNPSRKFWVSEELRGDAKWLNGVAGKAGGGIRNNGFIRDKGPRMGT